MENMRTGQNSLLTEIQILAADGTLVLFSGQSDLLNLFPLILGKWLLRLFEKTQALSQT